jgi:tRNA modification GTPase
MNATIFALATAPGRSAVAVVRVSGPQTLAAVDAIAGAGVRPRRASLRTFRDSQTGQVLDRGLVLWFPGPASYTGEDSAEFHLHGGRAVVEGLMAALALLGLRNAEPGEFTRRAFENDKLDLSQAEAVADLVDAETEAQRRQALGQLDGDLARHHGVWRAALIETLAVLEAAVDFPDEDLPETVADEAEPTIASVLADLEATLADGERGERVREGYRIALIGAPNAGKSSLLNRLAERDAAIVTETPGTTRDVIEVVLDLAGFRVVVADTAGLRASTDPIEVEGVRRSVVQADTADARVLLVDGATDDEGWEVGRDHLRPGDLCLINKADLSPGSAASSARNWAAAEGIAVLEASMTTGEGLDAARAALTDRAVAALSGSEFPAATRARHRQDLSDAHAHLARALTALGARGDVELAAEDVRLAARCLARVGGRIDPEDVLDRVFARFCIGK